jgi:hypothetical protein
MTLTARASRAVAKKAQRERFGAPELRKPNQRASNQSNLMDGCQNARHDCVLVTCQSTTPPPLETRMVYSDSASDLGVDVEVIVTHPCIFCMENH